MFLSIPDDKEKPKPPAPVIKPNQSFTVGQNDSKAIVLKGTDLNNVKSVQFEGAKLDIRPQAGNKELLIFLTRAITARPGSAQLVLTANDDTTSLIDLTLHPEEKSMTMKKMDADVLHKHVIKHATKMVRSLHAALREAGIKEMKVQVLHVSSCASDPGCNPPCVRTSVNVSGATVIVCSDPS